MSYLVISSDELYHYGVLGMKWGIRRYQNPDGTLTEAGKKRVRMRSGTYLKPFGVSKKSERYKVMMDHGDRAAKIDRAYDLSEERGEPIPWKHIEKQKKKLWDSYIDKYASAVLADLDLRDTDEARDFVKKMYIERGDVLYDETKQYKK